MNADDPAWEDLQVLLAAIGQGSLSAAADQLGVGQSTASRRIARLEACLGAPVLDRTPDGIRATEMAERVAAHAELIAEHMANIHRVASGEQTGVRGRVRIALPDGMAAAWLVPRVASLLDEYPELELDIVSGPAVVDLLRREADLALRFVPPSHPELLVRRVARMSLRAFVVPEMAQRPIRELRFVEFMDPDELYIETKWLRRHAGHSQIMRVNNWNDMFAAIREGLGAGILSPLVAEPAGLVPVRNVPKVGHRDLLLVYHPALRDLPRVVAVRDWLLANVPEG